MNLIFDGPVSSNFLGVYFQTESKRRPLLSTKDLYFTNQLPPLRRLEPLFHFGFGLSYTEFLYTALSVTWCVSSNDIPSRRRAP